MNKKETIDKFFRARFKIKDPYVAVRYHSNNRIDYDYKLILNYVDENSRILDIGCGTGLIEEKLVEDVAYIKGIDKYKEFLDRAYINDKIKYEVCEAYEFLDKNIKYDLILIFGLLFYMSDSEVDKMLENCLLMLSEEGIILIKGQWGVEEKLIVDQWSEGLQCNYYAEYRQVNEFKRTLLRKGFSVELIDIYPKEMNEWENTHEYAFVCKIAKR